ncbi:MAG TPA: YggT family protein [Rhizomicrobium sp.]|jgi:YggT family protein|nr:YggT family protein [Rhizomicrobium sp.]
MLAAVLPIIIVIRELIDTLVYVYTIVIFAAVIMSWLVAFGVLNTYNRYARMVLRLLDTLTEPVFRLVRRIIPPLGGLDLSPMIVLLVLWAVQRLVDMYTDMAIRSV